ncbi:hypothetical protein TNIN_410191 [Trichonephila inaurata madagascariensis]|uniref:Uncharacterized protein n=1 Tax=Trichonephila inaurata madagascariensis TaxID=2747483 RepID=A0A8X6XD77_9ARAC|nr:hypothetical protein TNIN_410191 [Trichonephila inaurata madagascariensis]
MEARSLALPRRAPRRPGPMTGESFGNIVRLEWLTCRGQLWSSDYRKGDNDRDGLKNNPEINGVVFNKP